MNIRDDSSRRRKSSKSREPTKYPTHGKKRSTTDIDEEIPIDSDLEQEKDSEYSSHFQSQSGD